jgi:hypothetical protein
MTDEDGKREGQTGGHSKNPRKDRLKLALRENLKRRKSQSKARAGGTAIAPSNDGDASLDDVSGNEPGE